jgi:type II secretory pathway pseudopilin PulG
MQLILHANPLRKALQRAHSIRSNGDTIIEVLMSIAIVGAVIAGAYALASRSLAEGVSASEHSQAIKMAEAQVEALKSRSRDALIRQDLWDANFKITASPIPPDKDNFCLDTTATAMVDASNNPVANWLPKYNGTQTAAFTGTNLKSTVIAQPNNYKPVCTDNITNPTSAKYFINIKLLATANTPTYLVTVRWNPAGNAPTSKTQLYYRF